MAPIITSLQVNFLKKYFNEGRVNNNKHYSSKQSCKTESTFEIKQYNSGWTRMSGGEIMRCLYETQCIVAKCCKFPLLAFLVSAVQELHNCTVSLGAHNHLQLHLQVI